LFSTCTAHGTFDALALHCMQALDLVPTKIHDRSPIFLGSYDDVEEIKALYAEQAKSSSASS
jgi:fructose-1,6-bisphosphatase